MNSILLRAFLASCIDYCRHTHTSFRSILLVIKNHTPHVLETFFRYSIPSNPIACNRWTLLWCNFKLLWSLRNFKMFANKSNIPGLHQKASRTPSLFQRLQEACTLLVQQTIYRFIPDKRRMLLPSDAWPSRCGQCRLCTISTYFHSWNRHTVDFSETRPFCV